MQGQSQLPSLNSNLKVLLKNLSTASNPEEAVTSILKSNPQTRNIMSILNSSGMSPKDFFYNYANSQGVDPDQFINSLMD